MAKITEFKGYTDPSQMPKIPKPDTPPDPQIVTVQDGVPVVYPGCHGLGVRVVHPVNPKAPSKNASLVMFYVPPHVVLEPGSHPTEETYVILEGEGEMTFARWKRKVKKGDFVYLPSWCVHGIENTGNETLVVLICTSPPNP
ncbi:MAG: cupin domain-containing protein [Planctomycetes bacterium]|nr:cupin domain-containing protein [Planctomycetota bacterium]